MKLHSVWVENFRRFVEPVELGAFGDGLNLFVGDNETGKSTLVAAIRGALFERHKAKNERTRSFQHVRNQTAPRVRVVFELADGAYSLEKQFLRSPYARLDLPDGRRLEGDDAEDELERRLGFARAGRTGADDATMGPWGALWVEQGRTTDAPAASESARMSIHACLEGEVGALLGGNRTQRLVRRLDEVLGERMTGQGKPRGRLKELSESVALLEGDLAKRRLARAQLQEQYATLARSQDDLRRLSDPRRDAEDATELAAARTAREQVAAKRAHALARRQELGAKRAQRERMEEAGSRRARLVAALAEIETAARSAETEESRLAERQGILDTQRTEQAQTVRKHDEAVAEIEKRLGEAMRRAGAERARAEAARLTELHGQVKAVQAAAEASRARATAIDIAAIDAALQAAREAEAVEAKLAVAAPRLEARLEPQARPRVRVAAKAPTADVFGIEITGTTDITIEGVGTFTIVPGADGQDGLRERRAALLRERDRQLAKAGSVDLEAAAAAKNEAQRLVQEAAAQDRVLQTLLPEARKAGVTKAIADLEARIAVLAAQGAAAGAAGEDFETLKEGLTAARTGLEAARAAREETETALTAVRERLAELRAQQAASRADRARWEGELERLDREAAPEDRARAIEVIAGVIARLETDVAALEAEASDAALALADARIERIEGAVKQRAAQRNSLELLIARTRATIEAGAGEGLDEQIAMAERDLERARLELNALERDTAVLQLLATELHAAEAAAKERFLAPIEGRVAPYLSRLLDGAALRMDENLSLVGIARPGIGEESFDTLSHGTREQVAVLVRLAFAEILAARGKPAMLILDDVLSFSDDRRRDAMFDILTVAARRMQVVIFSCHEDAFARLGAHRLALAPVPPG